jgi:MYXO-CTERM domain-containing protein
VTVYSWSYDDTGAAITIAPTAIPGGAGLAALAFGAAGLRGRRRSRN